MVDKHKILRFSACWDMRFDHQVASAASEVAHGEFQGFYSLNRPLMTTVKRGWTIEKTSSSDTEHLLVWRRITDRLSQNTSARMRRVGDRRAEPPLVIKASLLPKQWLIQEKNDWCEIIWFPSALTFWPSCFFWESAFRSCHVIALGCVLGPCFLVFKVGFKAG